MSRARRAVSNLVDHPPIISVLCVDDNAFVARAVELKLRDSGGLHWLGHLESAEGLAAAVAHQRPSVVLVDIDMPGPDPFDVIAEISERTETSRLLVFSGHVRCDLVERAIRAGAWGYISKNDGPEALVRGIYCVASGEFAMSPEVRTVCEHG